MDIATIGGLNSLPLSSPDMAARLRACNYDFAQAFRANATSLPRNAWERFDAAILRVARDVMVAVADLTAAGLAIPNGGIGTIIHGYQKASDIGGAEVSMSPSLGRNDAPEFTVNGVPIPFIHKSYQIDARQLAAAQTQNVALDTMMAEMASRKVSEKNEAILFDGYGAIAIGAYVIYGYRTHPDRNTVTLESWGDPANIYPSVLALIKALEDDLHNGPYNLYVHRTQMQQMREYVDPNKQLTAYDQIMRLPQIRAIKTSMAMTEGEAILVDLRSDTVDMSVGQALTNLEWVQQPLTTHYLVMTAQAPRIKSDAEGRSGIAHGTGA